MYKKNSWIVALLVALSFSAFLIGCIEPLAVEPPDTTVYTEVELPAFNVFGGNAENQQGWATDGSKDSKGKAVKNAGLTVEMFQKAKYLVVEVNDGFPKNNFETIYDSFDADGNKIGDWQQFSQITSSSGTLNTGMGTREGNVLKLEMSKIIKNYSIFRDKNTAAISLYIQHWGNGGTGACIKSAKLLVSDETIPFVPVASVTMPTTSGAMGLDISLSATVAPEDATQQKIIWSITGFLPDGSATWLTIDNTSTATYNTSKAALLAKVDFKAVPKIDKPASSYTDYSVYPPVEVEIPAVTTPGAAKSPNIIVATAAGTVRVKAIILGGKVEDADDFVSPDFEIPISSLIPYKVPVGGAGFFYVDLNKWDQQGTTAASNIEPTVPLAVTAQDKITVPYTLENQRVNFKLTDAQAALVFAAATGVDVDVQGTVTTGLGTAGDSFRYHIGDAMAGSAWNATGSFTAGTFASTIVGPKTVTFGSNKSLDTCGFLILQHMNAAAATVEITSIKITYGAVKVSVAGTDQNVVVKTGGNPDKLGEVRLITDGYEVEFFAGDGYGNTFSIFEVDLGATDTLSSFQKIEFDFIGIQGDVGWKTIRVFAFNAEKTGYFGTGGDTDQIATQAYSADGKTLIPVSAAISGTSGINLHKIWLIITIHAAGSANPPPNGDGLPTVFQITNIKLVK